MAEERLTTMEIFYNREEDKFTLRGVKEWEERVNWDRYMVDFTPEDILTDDYKAIGTEALVKAFAKQGLEDYLMRIGHLLREEGDHGIEFYYN
ncbi:MAG: hypothetical protein V3S84_02800, partial [Dehalococcoidales bacterium]